MKINKILNQAAESGNIDIIKIALTPYSPSSPEIQHLLTTSIKNNQYSTLKYLLEAGVDPLYPLKIKSSPPPLFAAIASGSDKCFNLLGQYITINSSMKYNGKSPYQYALSMNPVNTKILRTLRKCDNLTNLLDLSQQQEEEEEATQKQSECIESIENSFANASLQKSLKNSGSESETTQTTLSVSSARIKRQSPASKDGFPTPALKKQRIPLFTWEKVNSVLIGTSFNFLPWLETLKNEKHIAVAGFDLDSTLLAGSKSQLQFQFENIPKKLQTLNKKKFLTVIFTNQKGLGVKGRKSASERLHVFEEFKNTILAFFENTHSLPFIIFASCEQDVYRKPSPLLFDLFKKHCSIRDDQIHPKISFYCGDSAGRYDPKTLSRDWRCSDRHFALNLRLAFFTPEMLFQSIKQPKPFELDHHYGFNPEKLPKATSTIMNSFHEMCDDKGEGLNELVLMCGSPASGKSTFTRLFFAPRGYIIVNQDTVGSKAKCLKSVESAFKKNQSVVVDNTNYTKTVRSQYLSLAKKYNVRVRCFCIQTTLNLSLHLNWVRALETWTKNPANYIRLSRMAFNSHRSRWEEPQLKEGFSKLYKIPFHVFPGQSEKYIFQWMPIH